MKKAINIAIERALRRRRIERLTLQRRMVRAIKRPPVRAARIGKKGAGEC